MFLSKIYESVKEIFGQINKIDSSIYISSRNFADVYARNIALEEEIAVRKKELEQANKTILSLNSVWEMMNSDKPLSNMLEKIVSILHEELEYPFAAVLKLEKDNSGQKYFIVKAQSDNNGVLKGKSSGLELPYINNSAADKALSERKIYSSQNINSIMQMFFPDLTKEEMQTALLHLKPKTCILVPLKSAKEDFGCIAVFSERIDISDTEKNFLELYAKQAELAAAAAGLFEDVRKQAVTDPLTGLYNRRYFEETIIKEAERAARLKQPFSLISLDLDYLKKINDKYGHQYGDLAIKTIADVLKKEARSIDTPARIGGEEFNVLLPGVNSDGAYTAAERIRKAAASRVIDTIGGITASVGIASFPEHADRIDELEKAADQAMYRAKLNGRNQVVKADINSKAGWQQTAASAFLDIASKKLIPADEELLKKIQDKLDKINNGAEKSDDILFSIADDIAYVCSKTYNPGISKAKQILAEMLAKKIDLPDEETERLKTAVLLYDIGKTMLPEYLFNKSEPLTDSEKEMIKRHPVIAAQEILKPISQVQNIIPIVESHHENWDGTGYPGNKSGAQIPVSSQIVLLTDAFYAMMQDRPYRPAYTAEEIIEIIKQDSGRRWSKDLAEKFIELAANRKII